MQTIPLDIRGGATVPLAVSDDGGIIPLAASDGGATIPLSIEGAEGTNDYNRLINKPSINAVELIGDKNFTDLHLDAITPQQIDEIIYGGN